MKSVVLLLVILGFFIFHTIQIAPAPCCPTPPTTTAPIRSIYRSDRTTPPLTLITLPPTTIIPTPTPLTQPPTNSGGPITAETPTPVTRTTLQPITNITDAPTNTFHTTGNGGRSIVPPSQPRTSGSPTPSASATSAPSSLLFSPSGDFLPTSYFAWEDWWTANNGYLLNMSSSGEVVYVSSLDPKKDVPRLLTMFCYRGMFDKGIQEVAVSAIRGMGDIGVDVLISIVEGKYKFDKDTKLSRFNADQYAEAAIAVLGYVGGARAADTVAAILVPKRADSGTVLASKADNVLNALVKDKSARKRFLACNALGRIGDQSYLPALENVLDNDSDKFVRSAAAEAIARIGGSSAIDVLRKGLGENRSYYEARTYVAASLGFLGGTDPLEDIRIAAASPDGNVRIAAAVASSYVINKRMEVGRDYASLLTAFISNLDREADESVRRAIAFAATTMITRSGLFEPLKKYLSDGRDGAVSAMFALAYAFTGDPAALPYLTALPVEDDPIAETGRGYAMLYLASTNKLKILRDIIADPSPILSSCSVVKLAQLLGEGGYKELAEQRSVKDPFIQRALAYVGAVCMGKKGLELTVKYARGRDEAARAVAFIALGIRNDTDSLAELRRWTTINDKELRKAVNIGAAMMSGLQLTDSIRIALSDAKEQVRCAAIVSLGNLNRPETLDTILETIEKDSNYRVRAYACAALANVKIPAADTERVVNALIKAAKTDREYMVRGYAAFMLSMFKENRAAFEAVRGVLADKNTDAQAMAAFSLGLFGNPSGAGELRALLARYSGTPLACAARIGIGLLGDESNAADLVAEFKYLSRPEDLESSAFAIACSATRYTYADMLARVDDPDIFIREYSIKCLGMMRNLSDDARGAIAEKLAGLEKDNDANVRFYAAIVRYAIGDRNALNTALSAIFEKDFIFPGGTMVDYDYGSYISELSDLVNDTMPKMYRLKPYFWGEGAEE
ncbi:MAG: HEAT repeat domain-containing protein [Candidatus Brocadiia bacterium]